MSQTELTASHLNVERLSADEDLNYEIRNRHGALLARVRWLNVDGLRTAWGAPGVTVEIGGDVTIDLANGNVDDTEAAGAYIKTDD